MSKLSSLFLKTQQSVEQIRQIHKQPDFKQNVIRNRGMDKYCWASVIMKVKYKSLWCEVKLLFRRFPGRRQDISSSCKLCNICVVIFVDYLYHTQNKQRFSDNSSKVFIYIHKVIFSLRVYELFYVLLTHLV